MRIKFPDQPEKFMESEIDLHEALQVLHNENFSVRPSGCLSPLEARGDKAK